MSAVVNARGQAARSHTRVSHKVRHPTAKAVGAITITAGITANAMKEVAAPTASAIITNDHQIATDNTSAIDFRVDDTEMASSPGTTWEFKVEIPTVVTTILPTSATEVHVVPEDAKAERALGEGKSVTANTTSRTTAGGLLR
jgi:hypothetical protein